MEDTKYANLAVRPEISKAVEALGFTDMTEIQQKAIPVMMAGKDVIAKAPTGTGKTCAFGIPILQNIRTEDRYPQALILAPTRRAGHPRSATTCATWPASCPRCR